jgi:hypothetical protein
MEGRKKMTCDKKLNLAELKKIIEDMRAQYDRMKDHSARIIVLTFMHEYLSRLDRFINASEKEEKENKADVTVVCLFGGQKYMCNICKKYFEWPAEARNCTGSHVKKEEPMASEKEVIKPNSAVLLEQGICALCEKQFADKYTVLDHWGNNPKCYLKREESNISAISLRLEVNKMKHPCAHLTESLAILTYQEGCIDCEKYVEQHKKNFHPYRPIFIYAAKLKERQTMKHPCGKVFDVSKIVQTRKKRKARIIDANRKSPSGYSLVAMLETDEYHEQAAYRLPCGHDSQDHTDSPNDLVNVPEVRELEASDFEIVKSIFGNICLREKGNPSGNIALINKDGTLQLLDCIRSSLNLQLDEHGRIKLDE